MRTLVVYLTVPQSMGRIQDMSTNVRVDSARRESLTLIINVDKDFYALASKLIPATVAGIQNKLWLVLKYGPYYWIKGNVTPLFIDYGTLVNLEYQS